MPRTCSTNRAALQADQLASLQQLLAALTSNRFYAPRLRDAGLDKPIDSLDEFRTRMPFTTKQQIVADQAAHPPYGTNLTFNLDRYTRYHQTSATTGSPLRWLDTAESWQAMLDCWAKVFAAAGVNPHDRIFFAFSFGPFLGFWTAFEAATQLGALAIPGGGMSSAARLRTILDNEAAVLCATPTYALRLAEVAAEHQVDLNASRIRTILVAGEPGGSIPAVRTRIERAWPGARVFDHHGMTEVGPVSYENPTQPGILHVIEQAYLAEVIDPVTLKPIAPGQTGELVLTTLKRAGSPLLRYRTGDLVRQSTCNTEELGTADLALDGGILGRADDMIVVRGVNVFPSAVDQIMRSHDEVAEYRVEVHTQRSMSQMRIDLEPTSACADAEALCASIRHALRDGMQLRVEVHCVGAGELPRFEMKAKRWVRR